MLVADGVSGATLAVGAEATMQVGFSPQAAGLRAAELEIPSSDPLTNPLRIGLVGMGRERATVDLSSGSDPSRAGAAVGFTVQVSGEILAPADGQVAIVASTGESCTDDTIDSQSGLTAVFSCPIAFETLGPRDVSATFSASTSHDGGPSTSILQRVMRVADVRVTATNGVAQAAPGTLLAYDVQVRNPGPDPAPGTELAVVVGPALDGMAWTCTPVGSASCPEASGIGEVALTVDLPVGAGLDVAFGGSVPPGDGTVWLVLQAEATVNAAAPDHVHDPEPGNNVAEDIDLLTALFADGFE